MNIYSSLLFLHGHIADVDLARRLAEPVKEGPKEGVPADPEPATQGVALPLGHTGHGGRAGA